MRGQRNASSHIVLGEVYVMGKGCVRSYDEEKVAKEFEVYNKRFPGLIEELLNAHTLSEPMA